MGPVYFRQAHRGTIMVDLLIILLIIIFRCNVLCVPMFGISLGVSGVRIHDCCSICSASDLE